jgi:predicted bacteriocin transport accessory protein
MFLQKVNFHSAIFVCLASLVFQPALAAPPEAYNFLPFDKALIKSADDNKPMFLYFGRYGCNTCRKMHKEVFSDSSLRQNLSSHFVLAYVDTESGNRIRLANGERTTEMQFASRSRIIGTPTFVYFSEDQKPLFTKAGFQTISQMQQYNDFVSAGHYKTTSLKQYLSSE